MLEQTKEKIIIWTTLLTALLVFSGFIFGVISAVEKIRAALSDPCVTIEMAPVEIKNVVASWYSKDHCLGCRDDQIMANGQVFDDTRFTCAYNYAPLGTLLVLRYGEKTAACEVTDRVGRKERIDLSLATFEALADPALGLLEVEIINKK